MIINYFQRKRKMYQLNLPLELWVEIIIRLSYKNIVRIKRTCKDFYNIVNNDGFWRQKIEYSKNKRNLLNQKKKEDKEDKEDKNYRNKVNDLGSMGFRYIFDEKYLKSDAEIQTYKYKYIKYVTQINKKLVPGSENFTTVDNCIYRSFKMGNKVLVNYFYNMIKNYDGDYEDYFSLSLYGVINGGRLSMLEKLINSEYVIDGIKLFPYNRMMCDKNYLSMICLSAITTKDESKIKYNLNDFEILEYVLKLEPNNLLSGVYQAIKRKKIDMVKRLVEHIIITGNISKKDKIYFYHCLDVIDHNSEDVLEYYKIIKPLSYTFREDLMIRLNYMMESTTLSKKEYSKIIGTIILLKPIATETLMRKCSRIGNDYLAAIISCIV